MTDALAGEPPADPRDALIGEQAQLIAAQAEKIAALEAVVADLREQLATAFFSNKNRKAIPIESAEFLEWIRAATALA